MKHTGGERSEARTEAQRGERSEAPAPNLSGEARTLRGRHFLRVGCATTQKPSPNAPFFVSGIDFFLDLWHD